MQKAVVTGGEGFIGSALVAGLRQEGFEVSVVDIKKSGDVRKPESLQQAFAGAAFVFHLAALPRVQYSIEHPQETHDTNVTGTLNVLEAARQAGVKKVVFSSSSAVYGDQTSFPLQEDMPALPKSPYAAQKYISELYCRLYTELYGLSTVCLRYFNVYGPGDSLNGSYTLVMTRFIDQRRRGEPLTITGTGEQTRDYVHVSDVVRANLLAAFSPAATKGEAVNIGSGREASVNEIARLIGGEAVHVEPRIEPMRTLAGIALAKQLLGWEPKVGLEEGIAELKNLAGLA